MKMMAYFKLLLISGLLLFQQVGRAEESAMQCKPVVKIVRQMPANLAEYLRKNPGEGLMECTYPGWSSTAYTKLSVVSEHPIGLCHFFETQYWQGSVENRELAVGQVEGGKLIVPSDAVPITTHYVALRNGAEKCWEQNVNLYAPAYRIDDEQSYAVLEFMDRLVKNPLGFETVLKTLDISPHHTMEKEILDSRLNLRVVILFQTKPESLVSRLFFPDSPIFKLEVVTDKKNYFRFSIMSDGKDFKVTDMTRIIY